MIEYMLNNCYTIPNFSGLIGISGRNQATHLMKNITEIHSYIQCAEIPEITKSNTSLIHFKNGSRLLIIINAKNARGLSIDLVALHDSVSDDLNWTQCIYPTMTHSSFNPKVIHFA